MSGSVSTNAPWVNRFSLVMYDLDGTLVDSLPDLAAGIDLMLGDLGLPVAGADQVKLWIGNGIVTMVRRALAHTSANGVSDALLAQALERFNYHYGEVLGRYCVLYPGVETFLTAMQQRGVQQAVITNKSHGFSERLLALLGIDHFFSLVLGGDSLPEKKPHPMPLLHALTQCQVPAASALMVGDSVNDIRAAKAAGVTALGLPYGYNHGNPIESAMPDRVVASLSDLLAE